MNNISEMFFKHFEKILVALFGLALLVSLALYGPWAYSTDYDLQLAEISAALDGRPEITPQDVPTMPDYAARYETAGVAPAQQPYERPLFWQVNPRDEENKLLPPSGIELVPDRGYIEIEFTYNPNQPNVEGILSFLGVEVQRALVVDGQAGDWQTLTTSGARGYFTPQELYANNKEHAPLVTIQKITRNAARTGYGPTIADLFNAVYDGRLRLEQIPRLMRRGVQDGTFTTAEVNTVTEIVITMPYMLEEIILDARTNQERLTPAEALRRVLESMGYTGGGNYGLGRPEETKPAAGKPAAQPERMVRWGEIGSFFDSKVSADREYEYRVRFWVKDITTPAGELKTSDWVDYPAAVAPKPDTEFYLTGGSPGIGVPWVRVRKWVPSRNTWVEHDYEVAIGEEIGRKEIFQKEDSAGNAVRDASGKILTEEIDFRTQCVLLAFRAEPRVVKLGNSSALNVDNTNSAQYPILSEFQIVYSNRKGELKTKWQAPPG